MVVEQLEWWCSGWTWEWHLSWIINVLVAKSENKMATSMKAILLIDFSEYKQPLDKHELCLQLSNKDKEETQNGECILFCLPAHFIVYIKYRRVSALFTVYTGGSHLSKPTRGKWGISDIPSSRCSGAFPVNFQFGTWKFQLTSTNGMLYKNGVAVVSMVVPLKWWYSH